MSSYFEPDPLTPANATSLLNAATLQRNGSSNAEITLPDDLAGVTILGNAGANTYGGWVTVVAANVLALHALTKVSFQPNTTGNMKFQIGTGTAGNEVPLRDFTVAISTLAGVILEFVLPVPALLGANVRVAARIKTSPPNAANGGVLWAGFLPRPF